VEPRKVGRGYVESSATSRDWSNGLCGWIRNRDSHRSPRTGKEINPARIGDANTERIVSRGRTTTAVDFVSDGDLSGTQVDAGREPYLLIEDLFNLGCFNTVPVYDNQPRQEKRTGLCGLVLHRGDVLVRPDTLIYWK
jgi:hypothetical protein